MAPLVVYLDVVVGDFAGSADIPGFAVFGKQRLVFLPLHFDDLIVGLPASLIFKWIQRG